MDGSFEVGFVMAGAISAGAYSAGVMDFITEALDAYEVARTTGRTAEGEVWDGPIHAVRVPVIAGASAGGMTAAITSLCWFTDLTHVGPGEPPGPEANRLYASWVDEIDIDPLLDRGGLTSGVRSVLNCRVLDRIVAKTFMARRNKKGRSWLGRGDRSDVAVIVTASNLRGVPYAFELFGEGKDEYYGMLNHGDAMRFLLGSPPRAQNGYVLLNADDLPLAGPPEKSSPWLLFHQAVLATGAFPIGLEARSLVRPFADYTANPPLEYLDADGVRRPIKPHVPAGTQPPYDFIAVDGGAINNEPFELARRFLAGGDGQNVRAADRAKRAMILVDPFPNHAAMPVSPKLEDLRLMKIIPAFLGTLVDQARFKPEELALAQDDRVFSRFAVVPSRKTPGDSNPKFPIACAILGGFGGFLHHSFRRHDYLLGRRNAQAFLRWNFMLAKSNPIFADFVRDRGAAADKWSVKEAPTGTSSVGPREDEHAQKVKVFRNLDSQIPDDEAFPIIPLTRRMLTPIEIPDADLPDPGAVDLDRLGDRMRDRFSDVIGTLMTQDLHPLLGANVLVRGASYFAQPYLTNIAEKLAMKKITEGLADLRKAFPRER